MYIQKKLLAILIGCSIMPTWIEAKTLEISELKEPTKIKGMLTLKDAGYDNKISEHAPYLIFPKISGDGKTLILENGFAKSELISNGHTPVLSGENFINRDIIDTIGRLAPISISFDGVYLYPNSYIGVGDRYYEKKNGTWEVNQQYRDRISIHGITENGLIFGNAKGTQEFILLDPKNGQIIMQKLLEVRPNQTPFAASYNKENGEVIILSTTFGPGMKNFDIIYSKDNNWKKQTYSIDSDAILEKFFLGDTNGSIGGLENFILPRLSPNGKVVLGPQETIYFGEDYQKQKNLTKTLNGKNYTDGFAWASNFDGSLIGGGVGEQFNDIDNYLFNVRLRPVIWYGENWDTIKDLGTLGGKDTDNGIVHSISHDGKVVAGMSHNSEGYYVPTLWYIIEKSRIPALIEPEKTKADIEEIGRKTFNTFQNQRYGLLNLLEGCQVENGQGHYCLGLSSSMWGQKQDREAKIGISMAYALTDNFSIGSAIEHIVYNNIFASNKYRNLGLGLFAEWKNKQRNKEFYLRPAISFSFHQGNLERPIRAGTKYAYSKINMKGTALSLTFGEQYKLANNANLDWFAGIRYMNLEQKQHQDSSEYFPIQYDAMRYQESNIFAGFAFKKALTDKLNWLSKLELEQIIHQRNPIFLAHNPYLGDIEFKHKLARNSLSLSTGLEYQINDNFRISLAPGITKYSAQPIRWNIGLNLIGQF